VSAGAAPRPHRYLIAPLLTNGEAVSSPFSRAAWSSLLGEAVWSMWATIADRLESGPVEVDDHHDVRASLAELGRHGLARGIAPGHWQVRDRCPRPAG
jgi:hypothetical protein